MLVEIVSQILLMDFNVIFQMATQGCTSAPGIVHVDSTDKYPHHPDQFYVIV